MIFVDSWFVISLMYDLIFIYSCSQSLGENRVYWSTLPIHSCDVINISHLDGGSHCEAQKNTCWCIKVMISQQWTQARCWRTCDACKTYPQSLAIMFPEHGLEMCWLLFGMLAYYMLNPPLKWASVGTTKWSRQDQLQIPQTRIYLTLNHVMDVPVLTPNI